MTDKAFRERLAGNPEFVLNENGLEISAGITVKARSAVSRLSRLVRTRPRLACVDSQRGTHAELSQEELSAVAVGRTCDTTLGPAFTVPSCISTVSSKSTKCP